MEPRAALAVFDRKSERFTLHAGSQGVFGMRNNLAEALGVPNDKMRLLTGNVGGSFGMKGSVFPEYICILHAARELGRPVKWTDQRSESFVADHHGRDMEVVAELALDKKGRFLAPASPARAIMGAYLTPVGPMMRPLNIAKNSIGMYRTPFVEVNTTCAMTNTAPIGAYRGAGRPEGNYYMERLIDAGRRRDGHRPASSCAGATSWRQPNCPDHAGRHRPMTAAISRACSTGRWRPRTGRASARARRSRKRGKLRGRGIGCYLEVTAPPSNEMGGIHFEADGTVTIVTGTLDYGQGHWSAFAQVLRDSSAFPSTRSACCRATATSSSPAAAPAARSRSWRAARPSSRRATLVIEKGRQIAAHVLEAASPTSSSPTAASPSPARTAPSASWTLRRSCATGWTFRPSCRRR